MREFPFLSSSCVYIEIAQSSLQAVHGADSVEVPLERLDTGRLSRPCRERLIVSLKNLLQKGSWQARLHAYCAIGARGVTLRRLTLPSAGKEELQRLLLLQIESEFPLPPDGLAWGYRLLGQANPLPLEANAKQDLLVVAVKKEVVEEYAEILSACGLTPVFTLAALARGRLASHPLESYALLDVGRTHSELASFENGVPTSVRVLSWGDDTITRSIEKALGITPDEAQKLKLQFDQGIAPEGEAGRRVRGAVEAALDALGRSLNGVGSSRRIYLTGNCSTQKEIVSGLVRRLGNAAPCELLQAGQGKGGSAAILGLKRFVEQDGSGPTVILQVKPTNGAASATRPAPWKWAALAVLLALACLSFPYAEAVFLKARLSKRLAAIKADRGRLATIDREADFLQFLKQSQPPYLDAMYLLSKAAQPGTRLNSITMNRRGDVSMSGSLRDGTQVADFRSKLMDSGFFSTVVVDEQTPTQNRDKVNVRITAQWKSATDRESLAVGPTAAEMAKPKPAGSEMPRGGPAPMASPVPEMPPAAMPPGVVPPSASPAPAPARMSAPRPEIKE